MLFRTSQQDEETLLSAECSLIFELVIFVAQKGQITELSCGYSEIELSKLQRDLSNHKLDIKGGSPLTKVEIQRDDVHTKRTGVAGLIKAFNPNITTSLNITVR